MDMVPRLQTMAAVCLGTDYLRQNKEDYLPQEIREDDDAWLERVQKSVLTPYVLRIIENAASIILRRPIEVIGDEYWKDFIHDVDGIGSSLNEYAKTFLVDALRDGHAFTLVDAPPKSARTLYEARKDGIRPYFVPYAAAQCYGWRQATTAPYSPLSQVRLISKAVLPDAANPYHESTVEQMRVIYPGRYELHTSTELDVQMGTYGDGKIKEVPLVTLYTNRMGMLLSTPLLIDLAYINLAHYRAQADRLHSIHIAAMQQLILEAHENSKFLIAGVNYALRLDPGNKAYYLQTDAAAYLAQKELLEDLEQQMATLGVTKLVGQKMVAESEGAKRLDQAQANSTLSLISQELERCLNKMFQLAGLYAGKPAPQIILDRDFDFSTLLGQDVSVIGTLHKEGQLPTKEFVQILKYGEILPDSVDVDKLAADIDKKMKEVSDQQEKAAMQQAAQRTTGTGSANGGRTDQVKRRAPALQQQSR
jgi:hypothetical protein